MLMTAITSMPMVISTSMLMVISTSMLLIRPTSMLLMASRARARECCASTTTLRQSASWTYWSRC